MDVALERAKSLYSDEYAAHYRQLDEQETRTAIFKRFAEEVRCLNGPVTIDFGCGTGRYFHAMDKTDHLYAIDTSPGMLEQARNPVLPSAAKRSTFLLGGIERLAECPPADFFFSIGVFGNFAPVDAEVIKAIHASMKKGGQAFVLFMDRKTEALWPKSWRRKLMGALYPLFPKSVKHKLDVRWWQGGTSEAELRALLRDAGFLDIRIELDPVMPDSYRGHHLWAWFTR